ncbi:MAG TPA: ABC transporter permease [Candidatus Hydrogenedentes bacterium]|nr:ABC transporter permease [Candidatus Hydrogenedentota bacterium]
MSASDITYPQLAAGYALLLLPLGMFLWYGVSLISETVLSVLRMTAQLLFVGFYLQVVFQWNNPWINFAWIAVMVMVADASIVRGCGLRVGRFAFPLAVALLAGVLAPLLLFLFVIIRPNPILDARYVIPIAGMILGNCLRADIVGIRGFYEAIHKREKTYLTALAAGATLQEAVLPFMREALEAALRPTIATMATIGVVSLPGMMTGVILGGADPMTAIKYQIAIMLAIFTGTAITVTLAIYLTLSGSFTPYGMLDKDIFKSGKHR